MYKLRWQQIMTKQTNCELCTYSRRYSFPVFFNWRTIFGKFIMHHGITWHLLVMWCSYKHWSACTVQYKIPLKDSSVSTLWGLKKVAIILLTTFSNRFYGNRHFSIWLKVVGRVLHPEMPHRNSWVIYGVSIGQTDPTRHAYTWEIWPIWQDTLDFFPTNWLIRSLQFVGTIGESKHCWWTCPYFDRGEPIDRMQSI